MTSDRNPIVSFILSTRNRRDVLLTTLARVQSCGLPPERIEVWVVDDAGTDGTPQAIARYFPDVTVIRQLTNTGSICKNAALPHVRAPYVVFLDDDSFPEPGSVQQMIERFQADPRLGAAVFTVTLPDGSEECSAYPDVFIGCGTGFRREALREVGGLPEDYFMQAEEYDLSLRLLDAGWDIRRFDELRVNHLKTPVARQSARTMELDVRNNLMLIARYFPKPWARPFARDWMRRYYLIATAGGRIPAYSAGFARGLADAALCPRRPVKAETFERFARIDETRRRLARLVAHRGVRRILFVDLGKNILAYRLAARACGVEVVGIADPRLAHIARRFRGVRVVDDNTARGLDFDAAVISNLSPVHAARRRREWEELTAKPVVDLFGQT
jgi:GT2 family glycosyltransferase